MTSTLKRFLSIVTGILLVGTVTFGVYTWVRVLQVLPASSSCATTLVKVSQQSAATRPVFLLIFVAAIAAYKLSRKELPALWRSAYLVTLAVSAALLVLPWIVKIASAGGA